MNKERKTYERYKDSGIGWIGKIPEHWIVMPTKRIFKLVTDFAPKNNSEELLSVYTSIGVKPRKELEERGNKSSTTDGYWMVKRGDIIVNKLLAWMGAIGISEYDGVTSPAYDVLRKIKNINPYYYNYLFRNPVAYQEFKRHSRGIMEVRLRLYFTELGRISLPVPPLDEQNKVVEYLNRKTESANKSIEKQEKLILLLKEQKKAIINKAVTKGLNPDVKMKNSGIEWFDKVPDHWKVRKLKFCVKLVSQQVSKKEDNEVYISLEKIESWTGRYSKDIGIEKFESDVKRFKKFDVLFSRLRPYLAKVVVPMEDGVCVGELLVLRPSKTIIPDYLKFTLLNEVLINLIDGSTFGAKMPRASWEFIGQIKILIPPLKEQIQIIDYIEKQILKVDNAISQAEREIKLTKEYMESLIYNVVTGQIAVE